MTRPAVLVLGPADYRRMRWRNGRGMTMEIAARPASGESDAEFLWRVSLATIEASGPFSTFPGLDRVFLVAEGEGVCLDGVGTVQPLSLSAGSRTSFPGEAAVDCRLIAGPVLAFNLMLKRGFGTGTVAAVSGGTGHALEGPASSHVVHALRGDAELIFPDHPATALREGKTAVVTASSCTVVAEQRATALVATVLSLEGCRRRGGESR